MFHRSRGLLAVLPFAVLCAAAPAQAAPTGVTLRVEGKASTLYEARVTTDARPVDGGDGSGPHPCQGDPGGPAPNAGSALADAAGAATGGFAFRGSYSASFGDFLIENVAGEEPVFATDQTFWGIYRNGTATSTGACQTRVAEGDEVLYAVGTGAEPLLRLAGPVTAVTGSAVSLTVTDAASSAPVAGATVGGLQSDAAGKVSPVIRGTAGTVSFKAAKTGSIRSNAALVCVQAADQDGSCGTSDRRSPVAAVTGVEQGATFSRARAPRRLAGTVAADPSGLFAVKLRLARRDGRRCSYFSGRSERLRASRCRRSFWFGIGTDSAWSYLLPSRLPRGSYTLDVKAIDKAGNREAELVRGRTRVTFRVR